MAKQIIHFNLPEHAAQARATGYAYGLLTGIASPHYPPGELPPTTTAAAHTISTNDAVQFGLLFAEGHDLGISFGRQAAHKLAQVLAKFPLEQWWPIGIAFAAKQMQMPSEEDSSLRRDERIQSAVEAFAAIYQKHLL